MSFNELTFFADFRQITLWEKVQIRPQCARYHTRALAMDRHFQTKHLTFDHKIVEHFVIFMRKQDIVSNRGRQDPVLSMSAT